MLAKLSDPRVGDKVALRLDMISGIKKCVTGMMACDVVSAEVFKDALITRLTVNHVDHDLLTNDPRLLKEFKGAVGEVVTGFAREADMRVASVGVTQPDVIVSEGPA